MRTLSFWFSLTMLFLAFIALPMRHAHAVECSIAIREQAAESELAERLRQCEVEIAQQTAELQAKQRESTTLERDIDILNYQVNKSQLEIKARDLNIHKLTRDIGAQNAAIVKLNAKSESLRVSASELMRRTNELDTSPLIEIILSGATLSHFFEGLGSIHVLRAGMQGAFEEIRDVRAETHARKEILEKKTLDEDRLKQLQVIDKRKNEQKEREKNRILALTRGEEKEYQEILRQKQRVAAEIKNRILRLQGGGELTFGEALQIARVPERELGVPASLTLAVLTQESAIDGVIGRNLGRCFYNTPWKNAAGTVMSDTQKSSFLYILDQLGLEPNTTPVSCPIPSDGSYGGAMGPSQFMPRTWWDVDAGAGYSTRIGKITGHNPPSPFDNLDAFTGTALYLSDGLSGCSQIYDSQHSRQSCAAAKYYAGGNWRRHMSGYGARVANRAAEFQKDVDFLDAQI